MAARPSSFFFGVAGRALAGGAFGDLDPAQKARRQELLGALGDPFDIALQLQRGPGHHAILGVDAGLLAEAATDVEICTFPNAAFERLVGEYPGLQQRLFQHTLDELDAARDWMLLLGRKTAEEKVASFLYMLARRSLMTGCVHKATPGAAAFELPLTRSDMADYLGLTIETVSRQLTRLKTSNVIRLSTNRLIMVPDLDRLANAAGQDNSRH